MLLCPVLLNSHWTRRTIADLPRHAETSEVDPPPVHYPVYLREQAPLALRLAGPVSRGPTPPDPFPQLLPKVATAEPPPSPPRSHEELIVRTLTGGAPKEEDPFDLDPLAGFPSDFTPPDLENTVVQTGPITPTTVAPAPPRRLLLETSLPRARMEETIPAFELPVGDQGATLRLPIAPASRSSDLVPPPSSATYRSE